MTTLRQFTVNTASDVIALLRIADAIYVQAGVVRPNVRDETSLDMKHVFIELMNRKGLNEATKIWSAGVLQHEQETGRTQDELSDTELSHLVAYLCEEGFKASVEFSGGGLYRGEIKFLSGSYVAITNWEGPWLLGSYGPDDEGNGTVVLQIGEENEDGVTVASRISRFLAPIVK